MKRQSLLNAISDNMAFLSKSISLKNTINLFDSNRMAQNFFCGFFSLVYGYNNLQDLDAVHNVNNYPAIDLADKQARVAFQITTETSSEKIKGTIAMFIEKKLYKTYDRLIIYIIGEKKTYRPKDAYKEFNFDWKEDVIDDNNLMKHINTLDNNELEKLVVFLKENLEQYKFPDQLSPYDIKSGIKILKKDIGHLMGDSIPTAEINKLPTRGDDFIPEKNKINNLSWAFFKRMISGHLAYNQTISSFLTDPINDEFQKDYLLITKSIQKFYKDNKFTSFEPVFGEIFQKLDNYEMVEISSNKIRILLHNMYYNCDIGDNP